MPAALQTFGATQSSSDSHDVRQIPPLSQLYGAQLVGVPPPAGVMMLPEQTPPDAATHAPAVHVKLVAQSLSVAHVVLHPVAPQA
jgi:hypothetical protein